MQLSQHSARSEDAAVSQTNDHFPCNLALSLVGLYRNFNERQSDGDTIDGDW
jgi:hypothetical protein